MKYESAKVSSDIKLEGIKVEFETHDRSIKYCTLTDGKGNTVRFGNTSSYESLKIFVPEVPKKEKRFILTGDTPVSKIKEVFEDKYAAGNRKSEIECVFRADQQVELEVKEVEVAIQDDGSVKDEDIPF